MTYCNYTIFTSILTNLFPTSGKKKRRVRGTGPLVRLLAQVGGVDRFSQQVTPGDVLGSWSKKRRENMGKTWEKPGKTWEFMEEHHGEIMWRISEFHQRICPFWSSFLRKNYIVLSDSPEVSDNLNQLSPNFTGWCRLVHWFYRELITGKISWIGEMETWKWIRLTWGT